MYSSMGKGQWGCTQPQDSGAILKVVAVEGDTMVMEDTSEARATRILELRVVALCLSEEEGGAFNLGEEVWKYILVEQFYDLMSYR